jgi:hypothetical protein
MPESHSKAALVRLFSVGREPVFSLLRNFSRSFVRCMSAPRLHRSPDILLRSACALLLLTGVVTLAIVAAGCQPPSETTRDRGTTDAAGYALVHASAPGDNHHWNVDVALHGAPLGTYALLFSTNEPSHRGWFAIPASDPALRCAAGHGKGCAFGDHGDIVAMTRVGPGGAGVLRAAFDVGSGGWFTVLRVEPTPSTPAPSHASFDVQLVSEALAKDEEPHRFTVETVDRRPTR